MPGSVKVARPSASSSGQLIQQEEVKKRAAQAAKKKKPFLFHWRGGYLTREILKKLLIGIEEAAKEKGKQAKVSLNWMQAVLCVEFEDMDEAVAVSMQNQMMLITLR